MPAPAVFPDLSPDGYRRHGLHDLARDWPETNCYVDLLIEVAAAAGADPVAALGFTLTQDFEGDQFTFFKFPAADLDALCGLSVAELAVYDDLIDHLGLQIGRGRLPLVEVDGFYLPDTAGLSYRAEHTKTTVGINRLDVAARRMEYFHNAGYFALSGEDFDGVFRLLPSQQAEDGLFPYTEFVKRAPGGPPVPTVDAVLGVLAGHLAARPRANPVAAYRATLDDDLARLLARPQAYFHKYTFNLLRQLGANHELLAAHLGWLGARGVGGLDEAGAAAAEISRIAKAMQFQLARAVARKSLSSCEEPLARMAAAWDRITDGVAAVCLRR